MADDEAQFPVREERSIEADGLEIKFLSYKKYAEDKTTRHGQVLRGIVDREGRQHAVGSCPDYKEVCPGLEVKVHEYSERAGTATFVTTEYSVRVQRAACPAKLLAADVSMYEAWWRNVYESSSTGYAIVLKAE